MSKPTQTQPQPRQRSTHVKDLEPGDIEDAEEAGALALSAVQRAVDAGHQPLEQALVARLRDGLDGKLHLWGNVDRQCQELVIKGQTVGIKDGTMVIKGQSDHLRSDNGKRCRSRKVRYGPYYESAIGNYRQHTY